MELTELKSSHKELSKILSGLFILVMVISGYVIQRDLVSFFSDDIVTSEIVNSMQQPQVMYGGLQFKYGTMNIFWPIIICVSLFVVKFLLLKQLSIWREIKSNDENASLNFDALNIYNEIQANRTGYFCLRLMVFLPLIALILHLSSGIILVTKVLVDSTSNPDADLILLTTLVMQIIATMVSLLIVFKTPARIIKDIKFST